MEPKKEQGPFSDRFCEDFKMTNLTGLKVFTINKQINKKRPGLAHFLKVFTIFGREPCGQSYKALYDSRVVLTRKLPKL